MFDAKFFFILEYSLSEPLTQVLNCNSNVMNESAKNNSEPCNVTPKLYYSLACLKQTFTRFFVFFETNLQSHRGLGISPNYDVPFEAVLPLILTRFQPGGELAICVAQPFQRFTFSRANPKTVETVRTLKGNLDTRLKPGENA